MARLGSVKLNMYDEPRDPQSSGQRDVSEKRDRGSGRESEFVYVNRGYDGSVSKLSGSQSQIERPTTVIREQYWACSKWPACQKVLIILVGILLGLVAGLAIWVALANKENPPISDIFHRAHTAPD